MSRVINKEIEQVAIDLLKHHPRNANHGDVEAIKSSLAVNGWYGSVVANQSTKHILAGNHRVMAAKALGWETVPVQWVDVTPEEELRILVVDNRTTRIGQDDTTKITDILAELSNTPIGLDGTGYSAVDLDALIDSLTGTGEPEELLTDPDEVPEEVETRCKPGDLWILGNHRLLCGDSTKGDDVERLMDGATVDAVVTDPPYGMDFQSNYRNVKHEKIDGDTTPNLLSKTLNINFKHSMYVWCRWDNLYDVLKPKSFITWVKNNWSMGDLEHEHARQTEVCLFYDGVNHRWPNKRPSDVVTHDRTGNDLHPTQKPVSLLVEVIGWTEGLVFDPFLGSGTTLIAAEQLGRKCYGMEISPKYCDVIIQRWENATGKKAVLNGR